VGVKGFLRGGREATEKTEGDKPSQKPMQETTEETNAEFSDEELQEFLEGDSQDVKADPAFKERLRRKLWEILRNRMGHEPGSDGI
jgi:hypothetical protein